MRLLYTTALFVLFFAPSVGGAQVIDGVQKLNELMKRATPIQVAQNRPVVDYYQCSWVEIVCPVGRELECGESYRQQNFPYDASNEISSTKSSRRQNVRVSCQAIYRNETSYESVPPTVTRAFVSEVRDLKIDDSKITTLPEKMNIQSFTYRNCDNTTVSQTYNASVAVTTGTVVTVSKSVTNTEDRSINVSGSVSSGPIGPSGSVSLNLRYSKSVNITNGQQDSQTNTENRSSSVTFTVPPKTAGRADYIVYEVGKEVPFSALILLDGDLIPNSGGVLRASQIIGEQDRLVPFEGYLTVLGATDGETRTTPLGMGQCDAATDKGLSVTRTAQRIPYSANSPIIQGSTPVKQITDGQGVIKFDVKRNDIPVIGPPDGENCAAGVVETTYKSDLSCGFNDAGLPNVRFITREVRQCRFYSGGVATSSYPKVVETLGACHTP